MTPLKTLLLSLLLCALSACASRPAAPAPLEFVLVRHAEKADDDPRDPHLNDAGRARAQRLAGSFAGSEVFAVYATGYKRTRDTAGPTASAHAMAVSVYDAKLPAAEFAAQLRRRLGHRRDALLGAFVAAGEGEHRTAHRQSREQDENDDH